jgi:hypothetical protein
MFGSDSAIALSLTLGMSLLFMDGVFLTFLKSFHLGGG